MMLHWKLINFASEFSGTGGLFGILISLYKRKCKYVWFRTGILSFFFDTLEFNLIQFNVIAQLKLPNNFDGVQYRY